MILAFLLAASIVSAQPPASTSKSLSFEDDTRAANNSKDIRSLMKGHYRQTGQPTFAGGFCFKDGSCMSSASTYSVTGATTPFSSFVLKVGDTMTGALTITGTSVTANSFAGDGSSLTGIVRKAGDRMTGPLHVVSSITIVAAPTDTYSLSVSTGGTTYGLMVSTMGNVSVGLANLANIDNAKMYVVGGSTIPGEYQNTAVFANNYRVQVLADKYFTIPTASPIMYGAAEVSAASYPFDKYGEMIFQGTNRTSYNQGFLWVTGHASPPTPATITPVMRLNVDGKLCRGCTDTTYEFDTRGQSAFGNAGTQSIFNSVGQLTMAAGANITLSGSGGYIASVSSITGSHFGDGSHLTGITDTAEAAARATADFAIGASTKTTNAILAQVGVDTQTLHTEQVLTSRIDLTTVTTAIATKQNSFVGISSSACTGYIGGSVYANGVVTGGTCTSDASGTESNTYTSSKTFTAGVGIPTGGFSVGASTFMVTGSRVGIGTASPSEKMEVAGTIKATTGTYGTDGRILLTSYGPFSPNTALSLNGSNGAIGASPTASINGFLGGPGTTPDLYIVTPSTMYFYTGGAIRGAWRTDGNLGVGTASPSRTLTIKSPAATGSYDGNRFVISDFAASTLEHYQSTAANEWYSNVDMALGAGGHDRLYIESSNGNVGIGTSSPCSTCTLHVKGTIVSRGVVDGTQVGPGEVGEIVTAIGTIANQPQGASDSYVAVATMTLSAGEWEINGWCAMITGATTASNARSCAISKLNYAVDAATANLTFSGVAPVSQYLRIPTGTRHLSLTSSTNIYLVGSYTYTVLGSAYHYTVLSYMSARRIR